jgi:predicted deacylase
LYILMQAGIPAVLVEIGEGGKLNAGHVETGTRGAVNVLRFLGMVDGPAEPCPEPFVASAMLNVRSPAGGLLYMLTTPGARIESGATVARIVGIPEGETIVRSPADGIVLRTMTSGVVVPGDRIVVLGAAGT